MTHNQALVHICHAYDLVCPADWQGEVWRMVSALQAKGEYDSAVHCKYAARMLANGLTRGNWSSKGLYELA